MELKYHGLHNCDKLINWKSIGLYPESSIYFKEFECYHIPSYISRILEIIE